MGAGGGLDLSGLWRAAPADDAALRLSYVDDDLDDRSWEQLAVPGHWRSSPAFAHHDGPVLYRRRFELDTADDTGRWADEGRRTFLELDGVLAASDVWLDGAYLGETSGYVVPHAFEITELARARREHLLAMEVSCSPVGTGRTRDLTGALGRSALLPDSQNPGGIWRPVGVRHTGPVRLRYSRLRCRQATPEQATLAVRAVLDTVTARTVTLRTSVRSVTASGEPARASDDPHVVSEHDHPLATGENRVELSVSIPDPQLWWPRALGAQPRYDVTLDVLVDDEVSDSRTWRTGLRHVRMDGLRFWVNGEPLFLKGAAVGPTRPGPADATPEEVAGDVDLAVEAGLDLLRVHGHIGRPELYATADARGLLLWQDLPLQWSLVRAAKAPARRVARATVDRLAHHPSIVVWCAHHEPADTAPASWRGGDARAVRRRRTRQVLAQVAPSWNRTVLDRSVVVALDQSDGTRPVLAHSGVWPHLPQLTGTSTHLWAGWRWGDVGSLGRLLRWWPRLGRFVAEFGAQAPGSDGLEALLAAGRQGVPPTGESWWEGIDWEQVAAACGLEVPSAEHAVPPADHPSPEAWADALLAHQAEVVRSHIETLRRLKYRPTGGFAAFALADVAPGVAAGVLDHRRRPKPAWTALREACAPLIVVIDRPAPVLRPGERLQLDVHVVNDHRHAVADLTVTATARWSGPPPGPQQAGPIVVIHRSGWAGSVGADDVTRVGTLRLSVPEDATSVDLEVVLHDGDRPVARRSHRRPVRSTAAR